jgi:hypothetical protein
MNCRGKYGWRETDRERPSDLTGSLTNDRARNLLSSMQRLANPLAGCENAGMNGSDENVSHESPDNDRQAVAPPTKPGLGDLAEAFFTSLGITEERYRAVKVALELDPTCGCAERKKWLNAMGAKLGVNSVVAKMAAWMDRGRKP